MYSAKVMDHFANPRNVGEIENADGVGEVGNPKCGDIMKMFLKIDNNVITDVKFKTFGCGAAIATSSIATEMIKGKTIDEVASWVRENLLHMCHWFTVDDLNHLKRGGRVSSTAALVGTLLGVKPVLHVDDEGHLIPVSKVRGRRQSLEALVQKMEETAIQPADQTMFISHGDCLADAEYVANRVREKFGVKNIYINFIGPVIGAHSGPGTVALFFIGEHR